MIRLPALLVAATALLGCPPKDTADKKAPAATESACKHFGDNCEVSPGKLGTCVTKDGCTDPPPACFVCQSQH